VKTLILILALAPSAYAGCINDYDCEYGQSCVKEASYKEGFCAERANPNSFGQKPSHILQKTCTSSMECGFGQSCKMDYGARWGVCQ
jgi:hypothetical protein